MLKIVWIPCLVIMGSTATKRVIDKVKFLILFFSILTFVCVSNCTEFKNDTGENNQFQYLISIQFFNDISFASDLQQRAKNQIGSLPDFPPGSEDDTDAKINLGNKLFRDINLSANQIQACVTCHPIDGRSAGMDRQSTPRGTFGQLGKRNTPTILNVGYSSVLFWDGRRNSLYDQAIDPFINPIEMSLSSESELIQKIQNDPSYSEYFVRAFPSNPNISLHNVRLSLASFERSLISKSKFDDFVMGNLLIFNRQELEGLNIFLEVGCTNCHSGYMLGGNNLSKLESSFLYNPNDFGKFEITGNSNDRYLFKIPSLRNVTLTQPYFHDGSVTSLRVTIERMNEYKLNRRLSSSEIDLLIVFLKTLSDKTKSN
ncbi:cytochrome-c peroxidase [Leptospira levettii]|uniref:cytochrome-c peroxidase n=1 Tax=Leptospira levettii TaxID=2023178 RepID=UPI00223E6E90|nr:cytochrome c peroxidase [Leptospira levettii]MCW7506757.1 cytochrome-c peroxidase [Leptospira levettii]MCW7517847.1 cytochrome-c peroxidase [Leptospira levettii]